MDNQEATRLIRNLPTMCEFTDAYGEPIDSDAYYEAVDMAISALQAQDSPKPTAGSVQNVQNEDLISRKAAIDAIEKNAYRHTYLDQIIDIVSELPSAQPEVLACGEGVLNAQPEIIHCRECANARWDNIFHQCWCYGRLVGPDHYCGYAERRTDEGD